MTVAPGAADTDVAWVALGSNLGHRGRALALLRGSLERDGVSIEAASGEVLTRPIGVTGQGDFHNQVLRLRAPQRWPARRWLRHCRDAERAAGRRDTYHWGPRRADVDIILLGEAGELTVSEPGLTVPHPQIASRPFIARLLAELDAPGWRTEAAPRSDGQAVGELGDDAQGRLQLARDQEQVRGALEVDEP